MVEAMRAHPQAEGVQVSGCMALNFMCPGLEVSLDAAALSEALRRRAAEARALLGRS